MKDVKLVGISGASGSGKSFFAERLASLLPCSFLILSQDHYYQDQSEMELEQRHKSNFDHPDAIDFQLMADDLLKLKNRQAIEQPLYDFATHTRKVKTETVQPAEVVLVDGILIYSSAELLPLFDYKIFVDTPPDICFIRRLQRDITSRSRTMESVVEQYMSTVRPMFFQYVEPTKFLANRIVEGVGDMWDAARDVLHQLDLKPQSTTITK